MAASPQWKVYRAGEYVAACKHAEDAACLVSAFGGVVKHGHSLVVWREGQEEFSAGESYDGAAEIMETRRSGRVTWRHETEAEHAARDIREGRFPQRSAVGMVPVFDAE